MVSLGTILLLLCIWFEGSRGFGGVGGSHHHHGRTESDSDSSSAFNSKPKLKLVKLRPPVIIEDPSDVIVKKHEPTTLSCKAEGLPMPSIEWYKDGEKVRPTSNRMLLPNGDIFFLFVETKKKDPDTGVYYCLARNELGKAKSQNATVSIATPNKQPRIIEHPKDIVVARENEAATLSCKVEGKPAPAIEWYKDGEKLHITDNRVVLPSGSLFFLHVQAETDAGHYFCTARNDVGFAKSQEAVIEVASEVLSELMPATDKGVGLDEHGGSGSGSSSLATDSAGSSTSSDDNGFPFKKPWFIIIEALTVMFVTSSAVLIFLMRQMSSKKPVTTHVMYTPAYSGKPGTEGGYVSGGGGGGGGRFADRERDGHLWHNVEWTSGATAERNANNTSKVVTTHQLRTGRNNGRVYENKMHEFATAIDDDQSDSDIIYEEVSSSGSLSTFGKNKASSGSSRNHQQEPSPYAISSLCN